jgi:methylated-DNA-[protein]-cysteine S-methyltransferase
VVVGSPVGPLELTADDESVIGIRFHATTPIAAPPVGLLTETANQLAAYFAGRLRTFDLPLNPAGTPFQLRVWAALRELPYGTTCSYADLAGRIGRPAAIRAVGAANGRNPIPIVIPCHRVIGRDGRLVGFGGGLDAKRALLTMEGARLV